MPQEFQVLQCYGCQTFQVHQVKKVLKWACKMCGEKQSVKKVFGRGSGVECRLHVQKLNTRRGDMEASSSLLVGQPGETRPCQDQPSCSNIGDDGNSSSNWSHPLVAMNEKGKWSQFMPDEDHLQHSDDDDGTTFTTSTAEYRQNLRKRKREERQFSRQREDPQSAFCDRGTKHFSDYAEEHSNTESVLLLPGNSNSSSRATQNNHASVPKSKSSKWGLFSNPGHLNEAGTSTSTSCENVCQPKLSTFNTNSSVPERRLKANTPSLPSSQESSDSSSMGDNPNNYINPNAPFPDPRPYVSFDDLQDCDQDIESCVSPAETGSVFDEPKKHFTQVLGGKSKWEIFTGASDRSSVTTKSSNNKGDTTESGEEGFTGRHKPSTEDMGAMGYQTTNTTTIGSADYGVFGVNNGWKDRESLKCDKLCNQSDTFTSDGSSLTTNGSSCSTSVDGRGDRVDSREECVHRSRTPLNTATCLTSGSLFNAGDLSDEDFNL